MIATAKVIFASAPSLAMETCKRSSAFATGTPAQVKLSETKTLNPKPQTLNRRLLRTGRVLPSVRKRMARRLEQRLGGGSG